MYPVSFLRVSGKKSFVCGSGLVVHALDLRWHDKFVQQYVTRYHESWKEFLKLPCLLPPSRAHSSEIVAGSGCEEGAHWPHLHGQRWASSVQPDHSSQALVILVHCLFSLLPIPKGLPCPKVQAVKTAQSSFPQWLDVANPTSHRLRASTP